MRVAFVHDWLVTYRGGEKVLEALLSLYPDAPLYTLFFDSKAMPPAIAEREVKTPPYANKVRRLRKLMLPILPRLIESFDFSNYDLLISTSSCVAKGARAAKGAKHLCYLHSPMRYIWDQQDEYIRGVAHVPGAAQAIRMMTPKLRAWDVASAARVDRFVVNSSFVGERARAYYDRDSVVIPPPVELGRFVPQYETSARQGYFLAAGALVSYKRFDLAIKACEALGVKLIIAGSGPMEPALRRMAGRYTQFEISPDDRRFTELLQGAKALLFPGVEDFGMIAIEAMACGTPVIAYRSGGALDFIKPGENGFFFDESSVESLTKVLANFEERHFDAAALSRYASRYSRGDFLERIQGEIQGLMRGTSC